MRSIVLLLLSLMLAPIVAADALLVTVQYDSPNFKIMHIERIAGNGVNSDEGPFTLAYETSGGLYKATSFYFPIVELTDDGPKILSSATHTMAVPIQEGASALSLYDFNSEKVATVELGGVKTIGNSVGTIPSNSVAAKVGASSVTEGLKTQKVVASSGGKSEAGSEPSSGIGAWIVGLGILGVMGFFLVIGLVVIVGVIYLVVKSRKSK